MKRELSRLSLEKKFLLQTLSTSNHTFRECLEHVRHSYEDQMQQMRLKHRWLEEEHTDTLQREQQQCRSLEKTMQENQEFRTLFMEISEQRKQEKTQEQEAWATHLQQEAENQQHMEEQLQNLVETLKATRLMSIY